MGPRGDQENSDSGAKRDPHRQTKVARSDFAHAQGRPTLPFPLSNLKSSLCLFFFQGWSGPKEFHGEYIEGSFRSHQVPLPNAKTDDEELAALQVWLESYRPAELFMKDGSPVDEVLGVVPKTVEKRLGMKKESYANFVPLKVPSWMEMAVQSGRQESSMKSVLPLFYGITSHVASRLVGKFLKEVAREYVGPSFGFFFSRVYNSRLAGIRPLSESSRPTSW
jgi:phosphoketolase